MIEIKNLSKSYGPKKVLNDISTSFQEFGVHGILGPNGCGKTTLIKSMLGLVHPNQGTILLDNKPLSEQREKVSWLPQHPHAPANTTPKELFKLIEGLRGQSAFYQSQLIKDFSFEQELAKPIGSLSGGNYQKTFLIMTLMFDSPLIILDEPTVGLDPMSAASFKKIIKERAKKSMILLISHITSEIEQLSDQIHFLLAGRFVFSGSKQELLSTMSAESFEDSLLKLAQDRNAKPRQKTTRGLNYE